MDSISIAERGKRIVHVTLVFEREPPAQSLRCVTRDFHPTDALERSTS